MKKNYSPWLHQLQQDRVNYKLDKDIETDLVIVGAGIAGISTAFFALKHTDKKVVLIERFKLAHGATGHNAGQVTSYFERGFASIVDEFGLEMASEGQKDIEDAWELLDEMYTEAGLNIPFSRFLGHAGLSNYEQVLMHLKNNYLRKKGGLNTERMVIADTADFVSDIPVEYEGFYTLAPHDEVLSIIETTERTFVAVLSYQKGCVNSALFCQEVLFHLLEKYSDRLSFYEHTSIDKVVLKDGYALLDAGNYTIDTKRVVLCTNGFESVVILNESGLDIDTKYHHLIQGVVSYMSGYLEKMNKQPTAISYLGDDYKTIDDPYFYLTRRMYEYENKNDQSLISIGGPEVYLEDSGAYSRETDFPEEAEEKINNFVKNTYDTEPNKKIDYVFTWHGLMGYTKNGIRLIGPEPKNPVLMYNLGCNGIGILPSIHGGKKISDIVGEKVMPKSIFDVPENL